MKKITLSLAVMLLINVLTTRSAFSQSVWEKYESKEFGYTIEFPAKPIESTQLVDSEIGKLKMNLVMHDASQGGNDDNLIYMTNVTEYPDSLISSEMVERTDGFFRGAIDGSVANVKGKLLTEVVRMLGDYPGREVTVDYGNGMAVIRMRIFLVHSKFYMIQTITETSKKDNASVVYFLDSFRLAD